MASTTASSPDDGTTATKRPGLLARINQKLGLDAKTLLMMFKGSVAPTVAIGMFQASSIANRYTTLGYLIAIMSLIGMPIMPRGMFIQTMSLNLIATCLGAAINLLALYCAVQARVHTTLPGTPLTAYNSSASAVCAVWLCFQIYIISYLRAARPQFQFPAIVYSIFCMVSLTYGPSFPTMAYAISFMERLLEAFATGFALSIAVHFIVVPVTSRQVVCAELAGYCMSITGVLKAQSDFMHHMEDLDPVAERALKEAEYAKQRHGRRDKPFEAMAHTSSEGLALKAALQKTLQLHTKINGDIISAHREFAFGKLDHKDISTFWKKARTILTPLMGLVSILDHLKRLGMERHVANNDLPPEDMEKNRALVESLRLSAKAMHAPLETMTATLTAGLTHLTYVMELAKPPKTKKKDEEAPEQSDTPGSTAFIASFKQKLQDFEDSKRVTLEVWCKEKGIADPKAFLDNVSLHASGATSDDQLEQHFHQQLFLMLYLEYLLLRIGQQVLDIAVFAEQLRQEGKFKRNRLIVPGARTLYKWLRAVFGKEDMSQQEHFMNDMGVAASEAVDLGSAFGRRKDPEHLPPANAFERFGEAVRVVPRFFRSDSSAFAFRVVCATMTIAIIAYLQDTQQFFLQQRLLWAMIMVAISMSRTAGQSTLNFLLRIAGTAVAMVGAYIIWYIVDGNTPGVIVFLWLWIFLGFYVVLKIPKLIIVGILASVTSLLIVGYELQVAKLGVAVSESNGQPAYPTYELAPYRLACVAGGLFVAWIWTVFPYQVSEHSELRRDIAAALYLLANFYSNVHETVQTRVRGTGGDVMQKGSHAYLLDKAKQKVLTKLLAILSQVQMNTGFAKFQIVLGGKFPSEEYEGMIECVRRILVSTALIAHASDTLAENTSKGEEQSEWFKDFRSITANVGHKSHYITSTLSLLSSSLSTGQPLPPFLENPKPFAFVARLEAIDKNILSVQHIAEPEYSAFVVIQLCAEALNLNISLLKGHVTRLVGELDFSFRAPVRSETSSVLSSDALSDDMKMQ